MIADGYKDFVNKSDVASVVKEYVAIIEVGISGAGNGKLCSQLNTAISFDEAMYLFEDIWLFLYLLKIDFLSSPRRLRAKYTHRTKLRFVLCVFRDCIELLRRIRRWVRKRMPMHPLTLSIRREMIRMPRNSFVQMNKLTNVSGRITYISSMAKQENLYATYTTVSERSFWRKLAKCNQESFRQSGSEGKCIEARELIIALPESFVYYEPEYLLRRFTDHFKQNYKVECIAALHHNKRKTNYHIHLIFAERQLLDKPVEKIATRNMFYDEKGRHRRTKKEILDETGNIRKRCKVIRKGEVYEQNLFTKKNELFKADGFLDEVKHLYTELINVCAINEEDKLHVFDRNGMYLATKKIGKNNPKAAEIEADNMERVRWNQTVDRALISGVAEEDILGVKREKISEEVKRSIELYGNNPSFLAEIIRLAIKALELLISKVLLAAAKVVERVVDNVHEKVVGKVVSMPKDEPKLDSEVQEKVQLPKNPIEPLLLSKYPAITKLDVELKRRNEEIFVIEQERSNLEIELSECTGVFKKKQRKELQERISDLDKKAEKMKTDLSRLLQDAGYANAAEFFTELFAVREEKRKYEEDCKEWQEECVRAKIEAAKDSQYYGNVPSLERGRTR